MIQRYMPSFKVHTENGVLCINTDQPSPDPAGEFVLYTDHLAAVNEAASAVSRYGAWGWERSRTGALACVLCGNMTDRLPTGPCPCEHDVPMAERLAELSGWSYTTWGENGNDEAWVKDGIGLDACPVPVDDMVSVEALQAFLAPKWRVVVRRATDQSWSAVATRTDGSVRLDLSGYTSRWRAHAAAVIRATESDRKGHEG